MARHLLAGESRFAGASFHLLFGVEILDALAGPRAPRRGWVLSPREARPRHAGDSRRGRRGVALPRGRDPDLEDLPRDGEARPAGPGGGPAHAPQALSRAAARRRGGTSRGAAERASR